MDNVVSVQIIQKGIEYLLDIWKKNDQQPISIEQSAALLADYINMEIERERVYIDRPN